VKSRKQGIMNMTNKVLLIGTLLALSASTSFADQPVPAAELKQLISGKTVAVGNQNAFYGADGGYTYSGGNPGKWRVSVGRICVDFNNGMARCDKIVRDGGQLYMITEQGNFRVAFRPQ
jgi:hypothetical protein